MAGRESALADNHRSIENSCRRARVSAAENPRGHARLGQKRPTPSPATSPTWLRRKRGKRPGAADEEIGRDNYRGPLHGIPYTVKAPHQRCGRPDGVETRRSMQIGHPRRTAEVVTKNARCGRPSLLGKSTYATSLPGASTTPPTRNPWDGRSVTGGSSGGLGFVDSDRPGEMALVGHRLRMLGAESLCAQRFAPGMRVDAGPRAGKRAVVPLSLTMDTVGPPGRARCAILGLMLNGSRRLRPLMTTSAPMRRRWTSRRSSGRGHQGNEARRSQGSTSSTHMEPGVKRLVEEGISQLEKLRHGRA